MKREEALKNLAATCSYIYLEEKENFINELSKWFEYVFIHNNIPWRCMDKHKYCPLYADFGFRCSDRLNWGWKLEWPKHLSKNTIISILEDLGFYVKLNYWGYICISVPTPEKGEKNLTQAQAWVKLVNINYQKNLAKEKKLAQINESTFILKLIQSPIIEIDKDYTIFDNFVFATNLKNEPWYPIMLKLLKQDGIEEYYDKENVQIGYIFYHSNGQMLL